MAWHPIATSSLIFLLAYTSVFAVMLYLILTSRISLNSRWALLFFHVLVRLAAQSLGIAFGCLTFDQTDTLVAWIILNVEGYFTLVLTCARFLVVWGQCNTVSGQSFLEERLPKDTPWFKRFLHSMNLAHIRKSPLNAFHFALIAANSLINSGGSNLTSAYSKGQLDQAALDRSKALRGSGQAIFLLGNVLLLVCMLASTKISRRDMGYTHPTLLLLIATWPFLVARGIYGLLQGLLVMANWFSDDVYSTDNLSSKFVLEESLLGTLMEWTSCVLILSTSSTSKRHDVRREDQWPGDEDGEAMRLESKV